MRQLTPALSFNDAGDLIPGNAGVVVGSCATGAAAAFAWLLPASSLARASEMPAAPWREPPYSGALSQPASTASPTLAEVNLACLRHIPGLPVAWVRVGGSRRYGVTSTRSRKRSAAERLRGLYFGRRGLDWGSRHPNALSHSFASYVSMQSKGANRSM